MGTLMMVEKYTFEYDDPYKLLAFSVVSQYRPADVMRLLTDDEYVLNQIIKETRGQDMCGSFTDCIIEDILAKKDRMEYMRELDSLAKYYFSKFDIKRFRGEIKTALSECGIIVED